VRALVAGSPWGWEDGNEQMFDASRHEMRLYALDRGRPPFGTVLITYTQADERSAVLDVARTEMVEAGLDTLVSRRHEKRLRHEGADRPTEEAWPLRPRHAPHAFGLYYAPPPASAL